MRRRTRSAALSLHRHSVAQLALDGALAAVAYVLAYRLRFDTAAGVPEHVADIRAMRKIKRVMLNGRWVRDESTK